MPHVVVKYRIEDGFFSNVVVPMMWIWANADPSRTSIGVDWTVLADGAFEALFRGDPKLLAGQCADRKLVIAKGTPGEPYVDMTRLLTVLPGLPPHFWGYVPWSRSDIYVHPSFQALRNALSSIASGNGPLAPSAAMRAAAEAAWSRLGLAGCAGVVGVHGRSFVHYKRLQVSPAEHIERMADAAEHALDMLPPGSKVFLATHLQPFVASFKSRFLDRLAVNDAAAGRDSDPQADWNREANALDLARDVMLDALLLARCGRLIGGVSNVVLYVACHNPGISLEIPPHLLGAEGR
jgi:hypothetical protein